MAFFCLIFLYSLIYYITHLGLFYCINRFFYEIRFCKEQKKLMEIEALNQMFGVVFSCAKSNRLVHQKQFSRESRAIVSRAYLNALVQQEQ